MDSRHRAHDDQAGIDALLDAEHSAQLIINTARNNKLSRLRQVKEEAAREASRYRAKQETDFRRKLAEATGDAGALAKRIEGQSFMKLQALRNAATRTGNEVSDMIVGYVVNCKNDFGEPDIPEEQTYANLGSPSRFAPPAFQWSASQESSSSTRSSTRTPIMTPDEP